MKIVILDGYTVNPGDNPWATVEAAGDMVVYDRTPPQEVVARSAKAAVVVINKIKLGATQFSQLPNLKLVAITATGFDCVDLKAAREHDVIVCNVPEYGTDSVAQFVFSQLLNITQNVAHHDKLVHDGEWSRAGDFCFWRTQLTELAGLTMGIVGWGRIGQRVGELAHAFGMRVLATSRTRHDEPPYHGFGWRELPDLFAESDVVSLHCPLTSRTEHVVNKDLLGRMRASAILINTARGGLIVESDLAAVLANRQLAAAAVDVASQEPISADNPLLTAPNCIITPHMAWATLASRQRLMRTTVENISAFSRGEPMNVVS